MPHFERTLLIRGSPDEAFAWHERRGALPLLTPPWEKVNVVQEGEGVSDGARAVLKSRVGPFWIRWVAEHYGYEQGRQFCDRQLEGPFAKWEHRHVFAPAGEGTCRLTDSIDYELPGGALGRWLGAGMVEQRLERMFAYRHAVTQAALERPMQSRGTVVVSGASGLLGQALCAYLSTQGWSVHRLVRRDAKTADEIRWDPHRGAVDWPADFSCDAVVHLAGAGIADGRWTQARKRAIRDSRVEGTRTLVAALARLPQPPRVMLSGSAIGYYGDRGVGGEEVDENGDVGAGFLAEVCQQWEAEATPVRQLGTRLVWLRTGIVLTPAGGALAKMLPAFQFGAGGPMAGGRHWHSWISADDWVQACAHCLDTESVAGPVNVCAPWPERQRDFAEMLASVLQRPAVLPTPAWPMRLAFGEMADEALLASVRVTPRTLTESGYRFLHPSLEKGLRHVLGKQSGL